MKQRIRQITDIETLRSLRLTSAERELALLQQQIANLQDGLARVIELAASRRQILDDARRNIIFATETLSGQALKFRLAEVADAGLRLQEQEMAGMEIRQQLDQKRLSSIELQQHLQRLIAQHQAIQGQNALLRRQHKQAQSRRKESEIEEIFAQRNRTGSART
jgi:hypothetical protein